MRTYVLEVKAKFAEDSLKNKVEQLSKDIVQRILKLYRLESQEEEIIRENRFPSTRFHRLYMNLVDKDNALEKRVEELRKEYAPHGALFSLKPQDS